jgi:hypothetical protein
MLIIQSNLAEAEYQDGASEIFCQLFCIDVKCGLLLWVENIWKILREVFVPKNYDIIEQFKIRYKEEFCEP